MNRKEFNKEWSPTQNNETWRDYLWYCLLFGTVGSALIDAVTSGVWHTFFSYATVIGLCIMAALLLGWVLYNLLRILLYHLKGSA
jgi:mannose/fructose/N-acetylgalactosamine-specific phosphotransferase system component IID